MSEVKMLRALFRPGTEVELIKMTDPQAPAKGTHGIVTHVDDIGTIHVNWERGSSLGLIYGVDDFKVVKHI